MPALSSSSISAALEELSRLPASDRALLSGQCPGLAEYLERVPDPRNRRGVRHSLTSLLMAAVAAVLAGATSFTAVGEWVADTTRLRRGPGGCCTPLPTFTAWPSRTVKLPAWPALAQVTRAATRVSKVQGRRPSVRPAKYRCWRSARAGWSTTFSPHRLISLSISDAGQPG